MFKDETVARFGKHDNIMKSNLKFACEKTEEDFFDSIFRRDYLCRIIDVYRKKECLRTSRTEGD